MAHVFKTQQVSGKQKSDMHIKLCMRKCMWASHTEKKVCKIDVKSAYFSDL